MRPLAELPAFLGPELCTMSLACGVALEGSELPPHRSICLTLRGLQLHKASLADPFFFSLRSTTPVQQRLHADQGLPCWVLNSNWLACRNLNSLPTYLALYTRTLPPRSPQRHL
jgi:hypothetical protein